ncbi:hypothetical protein [Bradyrhizobium japonicum]|uniref:hypothetical protein n=1 Tax=Bradyrhizobium japonicum TaxID=375 RepID=UPI00040FAFEC|nr:hypothetical protein [Bradyrhizobium japonicum]
MNEDDLTLRKRAEVDIWDGLLRRKVRELQQQGMPLEQAEERAAAEIRRDIRRS